MSAEKNRKRQSTVPEYEIIVPEYHRARMSFFFNTPVEIEIEVFKSDTYDPVDIQNRSEKRIAFCNSRNNTGLVFDTPITPTPKAIRYHVRAVWREADRNNWMNNFYMKRFELQPNVFVIYGLVPEIKNHPTPGSDNFNWGVRVEVFA